MVTTLGQCITVCKVDGKDISYMLGQSYTLSSVFQAKLIIEIKDIGRRVPLLLNYDKVRFLPYKLWNQFHSVARS